MEKEERNNVGQVSIQKMQEKHTTINHAIGIDKGISQQNRVMFGLVAQNKDNAGQAHRDMRLATVMKHINTTQKMIKFKMTMWEQMLDIPTKDSLFVSITSLMDKVEDLNTQLGAVWEETRTGNLIVLSVLSTAAASMGLSIDGNRTVREKTSGESNSDYM